MMKKQIMTKYGECNIKKYYVPKYKVPLISSAKNKTKYFINKSKEIYGDLYSYDKTQYEKGNKKIIITCKKHGDFEVIATEHINKRKRGCIKCSLENKKLNSRLTKEEFINKSILKHGNKYSYLKSEYVTQNIRVVITCNTHGDFEQTPKDHMRGHGCNLCRIENIKKSRQESPTGWRYNRWIDSAYKSSEYESFKMYVIKCSDSNEQFIKIGRTYKSIRKRFRTRKMLPYEYEILYTITDTGYTVCKIEEKLKNNFKKYSYIPQKSFNGMYECFNINILNDKDFNKRYVSAIPK